MDEHRELPQEILDKVLDNILSTSSFKNCALASRSLLFRSQLHLFSQITIDHLDRCQQLFVMLTENHRLSAYIRKLTLSFRTYWWLSDPDCLAMQANIPPIIDMLASLRSFVFILGLHLEWQDLNQQVSDALFQLFARSSLLSIHLTDICCIPATFFNVPGTIDHLTLQNTTFEATSDFNPNLPLTLSFKCLEMIPGVGTLRDPREVLMSIATRPFSCFSLITDFRISPSESNVAIVLAVLKAATRSLTTIQVNHQYRKDLEVIIPDMRVSQFNLADLPNLRSICLVISVVYVSFNDVQDIIPSLCNDLLDFLITNADAVRHIENLTIVLKLVCSPMSSVDYSDILVLLSEIGLWRKLDETISSIHTSGRLRVNLVLSFYIYMLQELVGMRTMWQDMMRPQFPILEERGALTLDAESLSSGFPEEEYD
ncbi:hypothetical protein Hypma_002954 [Hypsizygus marmoreus]|uniref:F-box domain-containing protein n=1 Tax=Hypsizygus marmoreus TaxID=39966 RepID=A0A369J3F1_HYPMA|nr:hypothetical protein Hypma_002954 [Hypsizygus marmoreus]